MKPKIKKYSFLLVISIVVGAALLGAIGFSLYDRNMEPPTLRIGVSLYSQEDTFINSIADDLERMAQEQEAKENIRININIADSKSSQLIQDEQIERFISLDYDILCVNIVDWTAAAHLIDQAYAAKIPILFFNRQPVAEDLLRWEHAYYIGSPADQSGTLQGELALNLWNQPGQNVDKNGDGVLQYAVLEGEMGHQDALLRTQNCIRALTDGGVRVEKIAGDPANWNRRQGYVKTSRWIQEFENRIEVIFANNDDMALGAVDALLEAGVPWEDFPAIFGVDATAEALQAIEDGTMCGSVLNDGTGIAEALLKLSLTLYQKQAVSESIKLEDGHYIWLPYRKITEKDIADGKIIPVTVIP